MKNQQRPTGRAISDGNSLLVHSIFPTIQGEGPYTGRPAVFVRLSHCNLQCPACDTEYTFGTQRRDLADLLSEIRNYHPKLVVITGGEPFRQNITPLIFHLLHNLRVKVQVETNGMLAPQEAADNALPVFADLINHYGLCVVVSPKTHKLWTGWKYLAAAFKYVVACGDTDTDGLPIHALGHPLPPGERVARPPQGYIGPVYVQPQDDGEPAANRPHEQQAVRSVLLEPANRILCLQVHKLVGLD